jgi:hypothetical protein
MILQISGTRSRTACEQAEEKNSVNVQNIRLGNVLAVGCEGNVSRTI